MTPLQVFTICLVSILSHAISLAEESVREEKYDYCNGRRIFMYDLPDQFNAHILRKCEFGLAGWLNICPHAQNRGFGPPYDEPGWFHTDSYMLELIFHSRMNNFPCLTNNSREAAAVFVPYYSGLDALRYLYGSSNGELEPHGSELMRWLRGRAEWKRRQGRDHFMVMGRTAWDFDLSPPGQAATWGTGMLNVPGVRNMSLLFIERRPWVENEHAIPYPTFFHPTPPQLMEWTEAIRRSAATRMALFAFAGSVRPYAPDDGFRSLLMRLCADSARCALLDCSVLRCGRDVRPVVEAFRRAVFCLQPRGDTATRRSTFDAIVAGCVPVFFERDSAYTQYSWHLPGGDEESGYSVYIPQESVTADPSVIERRLKSIDPWRVREMQENVVRLISRVVYTSYNNSVKNGSGVRDAFVRSVEGVVEKIGQLKEEEAEIAVKED